MPQPKNEELRLQIEELSAQLESAQPELDRLRTERDRLKGEVGRLRESLNQTATHINALKESEARYRILSGASLAGVYVLDFEGRIVYANPQALQMHAQGRRFDVVVIDPPPFIKRKKDIPKGEAAYRRLNQLAMQLLDRDGILGSCSCSYHLEPQQLLAAIQRAARHLSRFVQVVEVGGQAPDHPIHPAIAETRYLKAFFCRVVSD